jgi:hypothetical protein
VRTLALGLTAALLATLTGVTMTTANAEPEHVLSKSDKWNDARSIREEKGLTKRERMSIDIHGITVTRANEKVTVTVRTKDVIRTKKFDQLFIFSTIEEENAGGEAWSSDAIFHTKSGGWLNQAMRFNLNGEDPFSDAAGATCWVKVRVAPKKDEVRATIPARCAPQGSFKVHLTALTGSSLRKDFNFFSHDALNMGGYPSIGIVEASRRYQRAWTASRK